MNGDRKEEIQKLFKANGFEVDMEEIIQIALLVDIFKLDETEKIISKHIDIDYSYGEFLEIHEDTSMYQVLSSYFNVEDIHEEGEVILYASEQNL